MPVVVALLDRPGATHSLRRGLARGPVSLVTVRSAAGLLATVRQRWTDAVVLGTQQAVKFPLAEFREAFPAIPLLAYGTLRADDGAALTAWHRLGLAGVVVSGVDDAAAGDLVARRTGSAERQRALADAAGALRLTEPIQLAAWRVLLERPGVPMSTAVLASRLGCSREHLSRQFGAGGAPNLKRVIDFLRVVVAAALAANPGYDRRAVASLAGFASPTHLRTTARRLTGVEISALASEGPRGILERFLRVGTRSRR